MTIAEAPMMTASAAASSPPITPPSERTVAFATTIIRSKPPELSIRDYISHLRSHIAPGRRQNALSSVYRHLDRSAFWRSEYERTRSSLSELEGERGELKRQIDELKTRAEVGEVGEIASGAAKKRKKPDTDAARDAKRAKKTEELAAFEFSEAGDIGQELIRSFYQVHSLLKIRSKVDAPALAYELKRAVSAVPDALRRTLNEHPHDLDFLRSVVAAVNRCILSFMIGFNRLSNYADGAEVQMHVVHAFVQMYSQLVEVLGRISTSEAAKALEEERRGLPSKSKVKQPRPTNFKDIPALNVFATFLSGLVSRLDSKLSSHKALFEGFAFVILERIGSRLFAVVFDRDRAGTIEQQIMTSGSPEGIEEGIQPATATKAKDQQKKAARLEAPYLIHIITRMLIAAPAHLGAAINARTGKPKQPSNKANIKGGFTIAAKERLQRTLVNATFGTEDTVEDDPFQDSLRMPALPKGPALTMPKVKEADVGEWFKEEMWKLLGWEILERQGGW